MPTDPTPTHTARPSRADRLTDAATLIALAATADPETAAREVANVRAMLHNIENQIADERPAILVATFRRDFEDDPETRAEVTRWRDTHDFTDVSELPTDDDPDAWTIEAGGSTRYEVREVPRFTIRRCGGAGALEAWEVLEHYTTAGDDADTSYAAEACGLDPDAVGWTEAEARALALWLNDNAPGSEDPCYIVVDTYDGDTIDPSPEGNDYDPCDEDDAARAAEAANREDYMNNACGWPFAHNYAAQIGDYQAERFARAGFVVARYRDGQLYAGIDGGGYDFLAAHWFPAYLDAMTHYGSAYIRTRDGVRKVVTS